MTSECPYLVFQAIKGPAREWRKDWRAVRVPAGMYELAILDGWRLVNVGCIPNIDEILGFVELPRPRGRGAGWFRIPDLEGRCDRANNPFKGWTYIRTPNHWKLYWEASLFHEGLRHEPASVSGHLKAEMERQLACNFPPAPV